MGSLEQANKYRNANRINKEELPSFHVAPPVGWLNDPNGFSVYQGKIHLFYQYHPYNEKWGSMHWNHCVTEDFVKWEELPVALAPDQLYDASGCFSGSGLETKEGHVLVYTGVMEKENGGGITTVQNQCIAIGNGSVFTKEERNPVVTGDMLPPGFSREDFRDPKVWKEEGCYYMVVGNKTVDGMPQVVLFRSEDLHNWRYVSVLAADRSRRFGSMWECPDFFSLNGMDILMVSPMDMCAGGRFHNGNNSVCFLGTYDRKNHEFHIAKAIPLDEGLDFYAPQTVNAPDRRRILIAWMQSPDSNIRPAGQRWSCMMTLPRELEIVDGELYQKPVREIEKYRRDPFFTQIEVTGELTLPEIKGRMLDLTVEITGNDYRSFEIRFAQNEQFHTGLTYNREKNLLELDRTFSGMVRDTASLRRVKAKNAGPRMKLRLILDKYSAEIFVNDGLQILSTTFYTPRDAETVSFLCDGTASVIIQKYTLAVD
ncbi:glycoside hydrolase family 32 protein [Lachnospiraceae bacterium 45-P1]